jgi:cytochrome c peroxidase
LANSSLRTTTPRIGGSTKLNVGTTTVRSSMSRTSVVGGRTVFTSTKYSTHSPVLLALAGATVGTVGYSAFKSAYAAENKTNWEALKKDVIDLLESNPDYDDGSYGPVIVRLAWHASGTYNKADGSGGSSGGTMRFAPEASDGANAGLRVARELLEALKKKYPEVSYGDLWTFAASVVIEEMGGPHIDWRPGRVDKEEKDCPPQGRLPDAEKSQDHIREVFYRMGFNDQEIVALAGAHALGRCHRDRSGFDGPWTNAPTMFSNEYFRELIENDWTVRKWDGPKQYEDKSKSLMMLEADMSFVRDPEFRKYVKKYAEDEELFFKDFAAAWKKLIELGVDFPEEKKGFWAKLGF